MFDDFGQTQTLPQPRGEAVVLTDAGAIHQGSMGAVGATRTLQPGETWKQQFCWRGIFLTAMQRRTNVYRNMYASLFSGVDDVLDYMHQRGRLVGNARKWHDALTRSNLPEWWLINYVITSATSALALCTSTMGGSFNESPVIMNGWRGP